MAKDKSILLSFYRMDLIAVLGLGLVYLLVIIIFGLGSVYLPIIIGLGLGLVDNNNLIIK